MLNRTPMPPEERLPLPQFAPVPINARHDGWTPERQRGFIDALAETGSVTAAAARVNMNRDSAYRLRLREGAEEFRAAWEVALEHGVRTLADLAIDRAIHGIPVPVFHRGQVCGESRWYDNRLLMFILRHHLPGRYGGRSPAMDARQIEALRRAWEAEREAEDQVQKRRTVDSVVDKIRNLRRWYLEGIADDPAKRAAWDLLCGPADWACAKRGEGNDYEGQNMTYPSAIVLLAGIDAVARLRERSGS